MHAPQNYFGVIFITDKKQKTKFGAIIHIDLFDKHVLSQNNVKTSRQRSGHLSIENVINYGPHNQPVGNLNLDISKKIIYKMLTLRQMHMPGCIYTCTYYI